MCRENEIGRNTGNNQGNVIQKRKLRNNSEKQMRIIIFFITRRRDYRKRLREY